MRVISLNGQSLIPPVISSEDLPTSEPTEANTQWIDDTQSPPLLMLFDGTTSSVVGLITEILEDITIYVELLGDDLLGDGSLTNPYKSIHRAISYLNTKTIMPSVTVTIQVGEGKFTATEAIEFKYKYGGKVQIIGSGIKAGEVRPTDVHFVAEDGVYGGIVTNKYISSGNIAGDEVLNKQLIDKVFSTVLHFVDSHGIDTRTNLEISELAITGNANGVANFSGTTGFNSFEANVGVPTGNFAIYGFTNNGFRVHKGSYFLSDGVVISGIAKGLFFKNTTVKSESTHNIILLNCKYYGLNANQVNDFMQAMSIYSSFYGVRLFNSPFTSCIIYKALGVPTLTAISYTQQANVWCKWANIRGCTSIAKYHLLARTDFRPIGTTAEKLFHTNVATSWILDNVNKESTFSMLNLSQLEAGYMTWDLPYNYRTVSGNMVTLETYPTDSLSYDTYTDVSTPIGTATPDKFLAKNFIWDITQDVTLANMINFKKGDTGTFTIKMDAIGGWVFDMQQIGSIYVGDINAPKDDPNRTTVYEYYVTEIDSILIKKIKDF